MFDWEKLKAKRPEYVYYMTSLKQINDEDRFQFLICADNRVIVSEVSDNQEDSSGKSLYEFSKVLDFEAHSKIVNMSRVCPNSTKDLIFTCSRDPVVKLWELNLDEGESKQAAEFRGHDMSVTSIASQKENYS